MIRLIIFQEKLVIFSFLSIVTKWDTLTIKRTWLLWKMLWHWRTGSNVEWYTLKLIVNNTEISGVIAVVYVTIINKYKMLYIYIYIYISHSAWVTVRILWGISHKQQVWTSPITVHNHVTLQSQSNNAGPRSSLCFSTRRRKKNDVNKK